MPPADADAPPAARPRHVQIGSLKGPAPQVMVMLALPPAVALSSSLGPPELRNWPMWIRRGVLDRLHRQLVQCARYSAPQPAGRVEVEKIFPGLAAACTSCCSMPAIEWAS